MALRVLGQSLLAKAHPGSLTRKKEEEAIIKPVIPEKGEVGSLERQFVEEPMERKVPEGTEKQITVRPGVEATSMPEDVGSAPASRLLGGQVGRVVSAPAAPPGASNQALLATSAPGAPKVVSAPGAAPGAAPTQAGGARVVRAPGAPPATPATAAQLGAKPAFQQVGAPVQRQAAAPQSIREGVIPTLSSALGGRVIAAPPPSEAEPEAAVSRGFGSTGVYVNPQTGQVTSWNPTAGQMIKGTVGKLISGIPALRSLGQQWQTYGGAVQPAAQGLGSVSSFLNNLRSKAQNIFSGLRSRR